MARIWVTALLFSMITVRAAAASDSSVQMRWLGCAGFSFTSGDTTILADPYLSRPGKLRLLFSRYRPNEELLATYLSPDGPTPEMREADLVVIGQSHFDHLGDAPWFAARTGARIAGTATTKNIALGYGTPEEKLLVVGDGDVIRQGPFEVRVVESLHGKVMFGRVPIDGTVDQPQTGPVHAFSMKMGGALGFLITHKPTTQRFYIISSADVLDEALARLRAEGLTADVVLPAIPGHDETFTESLLETFEPRLLIPHHFDDFTVPIEEAGESRLGAADLEGFEAEVNEVAERLGLHVEVRRPEIFAPFYWPESH